MVVIALAVGCRTRSAVAVRHQFDAYASVALWSNLTRAEEDALLPLYMSSFPAHTIIERRDIAAVMDEQDLHPDRLSEESRASVRAILGVEAIIYPNFSGGTSQYGRSHYAQLAVKVIDTETGLISASIVTGKLNEYGWPVLQRPSALLSQAMSGLKDAVRR